MRKGKKTIVGMTCLLGVNRKLGVWRSFKIMPPNALGFKKKYKKEENHKLLHLRRSYSQNWFHNIKKEAK